MDKTVKVGQQSLLGYLPAIVIQNILDGNIDTKKLPAYKSMTTVSLFADISGFTKLSEAFSKKGRTGSEFLAFCINRYMEQLSKNGGDIFKFAGDALLVIWPEDKNSDLKDSCRRALQCALSIQSKLNKLEMSKGKVLSVKVGLGVGECRILYVGGQFDRCEYLIVGEAMRQACTSECHCKEGGETVVSETVYHMIKKYYTFEVAEPDTLHGPGDGLTYYKIIGSISERVTTRADAYLMRTHFNSEKVMDRMPKLKTFLPAASIKYLDIEKEIWSKELRLLTIMFLNLSIDLSDTRTEKGLQRIQEIVHTVQRCVYRTRGSLNKFLMDDKGSVMLIAWGLPPFSAQDDHIRSVLSGLDIIRELKKYDCGAKMGITTGSCFTGVCGNIGGRREYSLLGEIVNLSARYMQRAMKICHDNENKFPNDKSKSQYQIVICEHTKNLIQDKIASKWVDKGELKGFANEFHFFEPVLDENLGLSSLNNININININIFPQIKTHRDNIFFIRNDDTGEKNIVISEDQDIRKSLFMVGRQYQMMRALEYMENTLNNNASSILLINGIIGSGKSLFLRNLMWRFCEKSKFEKQSKMTSSKFPFVFTSFQLPNTLCDPMNGFAKILRDIYLILLPFLNQNKRTVNVTTDNQNVTVECDEVGDILLNTNSFRYLKYIEEILDRQLDCHYEKLEGLEIKQMEPRDSFFKQRKFEGCSEKILHFFIELVKRYRTCAIPNNPLIFLIEDCHLIDEVSLDFIKELLNENVGIKRLFIIATYQDPLSMIVKNEYDHMTRIGELFESFKNVITLEGLEDKSEILEVILTHCNVNRNLRAKKVNDKLISFIISKSFKANPLFLIEIVDCLIEQNCLTVHTVELTYKPEFQEIVESNDWSRIRLPNKIEKLVGNIIDYLKPQEIIVLKHASVIGDIFDIDKLNDIHPFNSNTFDDLYAMIRNLESQGILEILDDLKPKQLIAKFALPFLREVFYQRMLVEQKSDIHLAVARKMQYSKFSYMSQSREITLLKYHLQTSGKSILVHMEDNPDGCISGSIFSGEMNSYNQKIIVAKDICERLKIIDRKIDSDEIQISKRSMPIVRSGVLNKKSDHGPTWEDRFVVSTNTKFYYWYREEEYSQNKQPLGSFDLKNIYMVKILKDHEIGDKLNLFQLQVSSWYKKDKAKTSRNFIFSCKNKDEHYTWVITFNFLRVKAIYDEFTFNFGIINLPLSHEMKGKNLKKIKRKLHTNASETKHTGSLFCGLRTSLMSLKKSNVKIKTERLSNFAQIAGFDPISTEVTEQDLINKRKSVLSDVLNFGFPCFLGNLQAAFIRDGPMELNEEESIKIPNHLYILKDLPFLNSQPASPRSVRSANDQKNSLDDVLSDQGDDLKLKIAALQEVNNNIQCDNVKNIDKSTRLVFERNFGKAFTLQRPPCVEIDNGRSQHKTVYDDQVANKLAHLEVEPMNDEVDKMIAMYISQYSKKDTKQKENQNENENNNIISNNLNSVNGFPSSIDFSMKK